MIFAITIASTLFSISDFLFTKLDIDKKERESLFKLVNLTSYLSQTYRTKIMMKFNKKTEKVESELMDIFTSEELDNIFFNRFNADDKDYELNKIKGYSGETENILKGFLNSEDIDIMSIEDDDEERKEINDLLNNQIHKEKVKYRWASSVAVMGLTALLLILTIRIEPVAKINNILTVVAFLSVIVNLLLKEYYKVSSLKRLSDEKRRLIEEITDNTNIE